MPTVTTDVYRVLQLAIEPMPSRYLRRLTDWIDAGKGLCLTGTILSDEGDP